MRAGQINPSTFSHRDVLDAITRHDFKSFLVRVFHQLNPGTPFLMNWHIDAIVWHLEQIRLGCIPRLIIAMPPRSLKSIAASVAFPAFVHGHNPRQKIICVSYAADLAAKLHNDYRAVLNSDWYRRLFPETRISPRKDTESEIALTAGGMRMATSIGGTLTGRGADAIVIDDPLKANDAMSTVKREGANNWYGSALVSRLDDKRTGKIVIVSQRLHMYDLIGYVSAESKEWEFLELPAIAETDHRISIGDDRYHIFRNGELLHPEREPQRELDQLRKTMGSASFSAQYLQRPVPPGGHMFKRDWVRRYDYLPEQGPGDEILQSWDTAKDGPANDWSVCVTWLKKGGIYYLVDVFRERLDYPGLRAKAIALGRKYSPRMVLIEDCGVGTALVAELRNAGLNVSPVRPTISKEARASVEAAKFEGGRVYLPNRAPWLDEFEAELFAFPGSSHDDQVDAISQSLAYEPAYTTTVTQFIGM